MEKGDNSAVDSRRAHMAFVSGISWIETGPGLEAFWSLRVFFCLDGCLGALREF